MSDARTRADLDRGQKWGHQVRERLLANSGIIGIERDAVKRGATMHLFKTGELCQK
jgi:hypothetical protein